MHTQAADPIRKQTRTHSHRHCLRPASKVACRFSRATRMQALGLAGKEPVTDVRCWGTEHPSRVVRYTLCLSPPCLFLSPPFSIPVSFSVSVSVCLSLPPSLPPFMPPYLPASLPLSLSLSLPACLPACLPPLSASLASAFLPYASLPLSLSLAGFLSPALFENPASANGQRLARQRLFSPAPPASGRPSRRHRKAPKGRIF